MMFFANMPVESTAVITTMLQELLKEILLDSLTTMILPCTSVQGFCIIAHLFGFCNSTPWQGVLNVRRFTDYSKVILPDRYLVESVCRLELYGVGDGGVAVL